MINKTDYFFPRGRYHGEFTPENVVFNSNLQEFAQRVSLICGLETGGKITPIEAFKEIDELWQLLKESKENLHIGDSHYTTDS